MWTPLVTALKLCLCGYVYVHIHQLSAYTSVDSVDNEVFMLSLLQVLAKLACGLNKPNRQTLVSHGSVPQLFSHMPIGKM